MFQKIMKLAIKKQKGWTEVLPIDGNGNEKSLGLAEKKSSIII